MIESSAIQAEEIRRSDDSSKNSSGLQKSIEQLENLKNMCMPAGSPWGCLPVFACPVASVFALFLLVSAKKND